MPLPVEITAESVALVIAGAGLLVARAAQAPGPRLKRLPIPTRLNEDRR